MLNKAKRLIRALDMLRWQVLGRLNFAIYKRSWPANLMLHGTVGLGGHGKLSIGKNVKLVSMSRYNRAGINHPVQLAVEPNGCLTIGDRVGMSGTAIYCSTRISIGNDVQLGANSRIYDTDFHALDADDRRAQVPAQSAPIEIGDDVWLAANVTVLKGVHIGPRTVVASNSVVVSDLPPDCLAGGIPAKVIRYLVPQPTEMRI